MHYMRWWKHGDPTAVRRAVGLTASERFWQYVSKGETCWLWTGATSKGYGLFAVQAAGRRVTMQAHRFAYMDVVGPIPEGMQLDHECMVRACVRPDHLQVVDNRTNAMLGNGISRCHADQTECIHGHAFTPENTYVKPDGGRQCKACRRATDRKRRPPRAA